MSSWVNHTIASMQSHGPSRRVAAAAPPGGSNSAVPNYPQRPSRSNSNTSGHPHPQMYSQQHGPPPGMLHHQGGPTPMHHGVPPQPFQGGPGPAPGAVGSLQPTYGVPPPPPPHHSYNPHQQPPPRHIQQQPQQPNPMAFRPTSAPVQPRQQNPYTPHSPYPPPPQHHHQQPHHPPHQSSGQHVRAAPMNHAMGTFSTYSSRIREANTALVLPPALGRRAKRAAVASMMESDEDDWDFEDGSPRSTPSKMQKMLEKERLEKEKKSWVKRARKTRHIFNSQKELDSVADQDAILVPIRLEIDTDDFRLRDTFTWNVNEQLMTPENFAEILCEDLDLNMAKYVPDIVASIRSQIAEFEPIAEVQVPSEGARAVIQLDLHVGGINLRDRFEWDVGSDLTPEEFSKQLAGDLGIGGEFVALIAHEIHEQLFRYKQDRLLDRGFDAEPLYSGFRPTDEGENWCPALETLTTEEYEKLLESSDRSVRRNRRETSRYGKGRRGPLYVTSLYTGGTGRRGRPSTKKPQTMSMVGYEDWQCQQCGLGAFSTIMLRSGPAGEKTLCNTCGISFAIHSVLPENRKDLFAIAKSEDPSQQHQHQQQQDSFEAEAEVPEQNGDAAADVSMGTPAAETVAV